MSEPCVMNYVSIAGVVAILLFLWKLHSDIVKLTKDLGTFGQRIAKIEGWITGRFNNQGW